MSLAAEKLQFLVDLQNQLGGSIPFERWMQEALYHPRFGYYTAWIRAIGRRGDFTTWPVLHESLARAIARWALDHKPPGRWHLIEIGAGTGELAAAVLRSIGWWNRPRYHIVEISPPLRAEQQKRFGEKVRWHNTVADALTASDGEAVIFSNELVDAFPCRIFQKKEASWRELELRIEDGRIVEIWRENPPPGSTAFAPEWPEGQRVEVQESFHRWLQEWLPAWKRGAMLTIDYGDTCPALYHRRPHGTLRAYAHHQRLEGADAYAGFGLRDLTVDVNFSDLQHWIEPASEILTLTEFLARQRVPGDPSLAAAGDAFKILMQTR
ncbi:MAG: SAM-dependent methyltransferase [Terrimicrobiaceae bacterium]